MAHLKFKITQNPEEIKEAQRLRYKVFVQEIKGAGEDPAGDAVDEDPFDKVCDHLIIFDQDSRRVIGTYRMLLGGVADAHFGFYTETKFDLRSIRALQGGLLEVGRSCVQKEYRDRTVLNLLWEGIAQYVKAHGVRYIFGSSNIMTGDVRRVSEFFAMFKALGLFQDHGVSPVDEAHRITLMDDVVVDDPRRLFGELPTLFKGYMHIGLKVCGLPAQGDFATALFPVLLDIKDMNKAYKKRFFGDYLQG